ncbi:MAG: M23 family metallopeptidase [Prevotella sp.]|nr:M23 family metallopeptidase [Prevotella sp.]
MALATTLSSCAQTISFTTLEQQKIAIETPGLFERSDAYTVDFAVYGEKDYCFPLPVGRVESNTDNVLRIVTKKGDAVKAMFDGVVRMSWHHPQYGHVVVLRHDNGLETVYTQNRENRVKVGQKVKAGQTVAIVGGDVDAAYCDFSIMINGGRINPEILIAPKAHRLLKQKVLFEKKGFHVEVSVVEHDPWVDEQRKAEEAKAILKQDPFGKSNQFTLDLANIPDGEWCYPLAGAKVISPYNNNRGSHRHTGVDLKTRPNDNILAAFDGVVTMSQRFYGYGNCIIVRHANGLETLYSHNVKNLVKVGEHVKAGQVIALTGRTGRASTEHLHFEVRVNGKHYNPNLIFDHDTKQLRRKKLTFFKNGRVK